MASCIFFTRDNGEDIYDTSCVVVPMMNYDPLKKEKLQKSMLIQFHAHINQRKSIGWKKCSHTFVLAGAEGSTTEILLCHC